RCEGLRQFPADQRGSLVQRVGLLLDQRQIMQRVEDKVLLLPGTEMPCDYLRTAGNYHLMDVAAHQHLAMAIGTRDRIVVATIAHQRQRTDPCGALVAGIVGDDRQRLEVSAIAFEALSDRLAMTTQPVLHSPAALFLKPSIEIVETGKP